jgi:DNA-binding transcriptional MerR regulator
MRPHVWASSGAPGRSLRSMTHPLVDESSASLDPVTATREAPARPNSDYLPDLDAVKAQSAWPVRAVRRDQLGRHTLPVAFSAATSLRPELAPLEPVSGRHPRRVTASESGVTRGRARQLHYWAQTGLVAPSIRAETGSGSKRLYSFKDMVILKIVKRLLNAGVSMENVRVAVEHLRRRGIRDLADVTLFSDGTRVYECTSPEEVASLMQGGQGLFGIAVGGVMREIATSIQEFPSESAVDHAVKTSSPRDVQQSAD